MANPENPRLAVLIDADNAQASVFHDLVAEVSRYGTATVKRAYGDWTTPNLKGWKDILHTMAIQPVQQFSYTTGKNSTDASLIIDAMDLLHSGALDGFCLVSSDSDFTRLATRIREAGLVVYGFGEKKTPHPFVAACDKFIYTEILRPGTTSSDDDQPETGRLRTQLLDAISAAMRDDGWAPLSTVGSMLLKSDPAFDSRSFGYPKLGALVRKQRYIEVKDVPSEAGSAIVQLYVRPKGKSKEG